MNPIADRYILTGKTLPGVQAVSYMHQKDLLPWKNILDNVRLPLVIKGLSWQAARDPSVPYLESF